MAVQRNSSAKIFYPLSANWMTSTRARPVYSVRWCLCNSNLKCGTWCASCQEGLPLIATLVEVGTPADGEIALKGEIAMSNKNWLLQYVWGNWKFWQLQWRVRFHGRLHLNHHVPYLSAEFFPVKVSQKKKTFTKLVHMDWQVGFRGNRFACITKPRCRAVLPISCYGSLISSWYFATAASHHRLPGFSFVFICLPRAQSDISTRLKYKLVSCWQGNVVSLQNVELLRTVACSGYI